MKRIILLLLAGVLLYSCCPLDAPNSFRDRRDGKVYKTVTIGEQTWMAENLRATKYPDGSDIPTGHNNTEWAALTTGAYAVYPHSDISGLDSEEAVIAEYGCLYNWWAAMNGETISEENPIVQGICPDGWHLPSDAEWTTLTTYLGGLSVAGAKMKEAGTDHWYEDNTGDNESSFTALPGGDRYYNGPIGGVGRNGNWWSSTEGDVDAARGRVLGYSYSYVIRSLDYKAYGYSVRCVKD